MRAIAVSLGRDLRGVPAMDAYLSKNQNRDNNFDPPPILIAADSDRAVARARATVAMAGLRVGEALLLADAGKRFDRQAASSAVWIELSEAFDATTDALLGTVESRARDGRYRAVVSINDYLIEPI